jgi:glycosyltransferase involved in cell wall biosynthesis
MCSHATIFAASPVTMRASAPERATPAPNASLHLFGAFPDPPTRSLVNELRASGVTVRARYHEVPIVGPNGDTAPVSDTEIVSGVASSGRREWRDWLDARDAHVLLAGAPSSSLDVVRRAAMARRSRTVHLWGERLRTDQTVIRALRRGYYGAWGLDGIFAVGSRAVDTYRAVTGREVPVHVLPWVTERGSDVPPAPAVRPTIGYTGRLLPDRGVELLLRALARLPASARPRLQVAGSGPESDALHTRAARLGIDRWVDWLGEIDDDALDAARSRWWGLIVPSQRADGWGTAIQTALNSGVPVIASHHVHAATDLIRPGRNGTIVRVDDPDRWADAIGELTLPSVRAEWSRSARAVGRAFAPRHAATWLLEVLAAAEIAHHSGGERLASRSFVDHAWAHLVTDTPGADPDDDLLDGPLTPLAH